MVLGNMKPSLRYENIVKNATVKWNFFQRYTSNTVKYKALDITAGR